jgi:hypothetical protein
MAVERVLSNLNLISFKTEGGLQNHIDELQDGDLVFTPDSSLKGNLFDFKWTDHKLNDISWLNADTFSWQSGDVYVAAYEHLKKDAESGGLYYRWSTRSDANAGYDRVMKTGTPTVGEKFYTANDEGWVDTGVTVAQIIDENTIVDSEGSTLYWLGSMVNLPADRKEETISGTTVTYFQSEDGHKICRPDQEANVQALYESTGVAWYYILDTKNKQFKLPRTKFGFTGLRDAVGKYVPAGLPNITGSVGYTIGTNDTATGAFTKDANSNSAWWEGSKNVARASKFHLNASNSSSIYGNGNTVQPPATQMYLYFYVGNFERDAIEQTAGINAEIFNNKADVVELQNKTRHVVVEFQEPTSSNNATWYRIYNDGWVEQGGTVKGSWGIAAGEEKIPSVTVPIPVNRHNAHAFFSTRELYCLIMGYYWENDSTIRPRFGAYQVARTLTEFKYVVYGMLA